MTKIYWTGRVARGPVERDEPNPSDYHRNIDGGVIYDMLHHEKDKREWRNYLASLPEVQVSDELKAIWGSEAGVKVGGVDYVWDEKNVFNPADKKPLGDTGALDLSCSWHKENIAVPVPKQEEKKKFSRKEMIAFAEFASNGFTQYSPGSWTDTYNKKVCNTSYLLEQFLNQNK
jgi:hypothetical protein